jgi:hypothetical protein
LWREESFESFGENVIELICGTKLDAPVQHKVFNSFNGFDESFEIDGAGSKLMNLFFH